VYVSPLADFVPSWAVSVRFQAIKKARDHALACSLFVCDPFQALILPFPGRFEGLACVYIAWRSKHDPGPILAVCGVFPAAVVILSRS